MLLLLILGFGLIIILDSMGKSSRKTQLKIARAIGSSNEAVEEIDLKCQEYAKSILYGVNKKQ